MNTIPLKYHSQIRKIIKKARLEGYREAEKDLELDKEFEIAEEAHRTANGWCCACSFDMAVLEDKIKEAKSELLEEVRSKVIGEDEGEPIVRDSQGEIEFEESVEGFRNDLRAEQRQKLSILERKNECK